MTDLPLLFFCALALRKDCIGHGMISENGETEEAEVNRKLLNVNTKSSCSSNSSIFCVSGSLHVTFKRGLR